MERINDLSAIANMPYRWNMTDAAVHDDTGNDIRARIINAAARVLDEQGAGALTTRGVAQAAGVQAPTIYRLFGDKDGLVEAVAEHVLATYVRVKTERADSAAASGVDPLADLREGWEMQIEFGLANPALFTLLNAPGRRALSPATAAGIEILRARVHRVAVAGRLRVSERRAVDLIHAAGTGAVISLVSTPPDERDMRLAETMYNAVSREILADASAVSGGQTLAAAVTLRAITPTIRGLSRAEKELMTEWLDRAIDASNSKS